MKYLLVTCQPYKGGEIGVIEIYDSIAECLDNVYDDFGESFEEYIANKREIIENRSIYAGGDVYCFQIQPLEGYELKDELDDEELLEAVDEITIEDYNAMKKRWGIEQNKNASMAQSGLLRLPSKQNFVGSNPTTRSKVINAPKKIQFQSG